MRNDVIEFLYITVRSKYGTVVMGISKCLDQLNTVIEIGDIVDFALKRSCRTIGQDILMQEPVEIACQITTRQSQNYLVFQLGIDG